MFPVEPARRAAFSLWNSVARKKRFAVGRSDLMALVMKDWRPERRGLLDSRFLYRTSRGPVQILGQHSCVPKSFLGCRPPAVVRNMIVARDYSRSAGCDLLGRLKNLLSI